MRKIYKNLIIITLIIISIFALVGCGNYGIIDTHYDFTKAKIKIEDEWIDVEIRKWYDYEGEQLQLELKDGTFILINSMNCILYEGELPTR